MLIKTLHDDSIKHKEKLLETIPEKKRYKIRERNEYFSIKSNYNSNERINRQRSDSSKYKKYNHSNIKKKIIEKEDSNSKDILSNHLLNCKIKNLNMISNESLRIKNLKIKSKLQKNIQNNSNSPTKATLIIKHTKLKKDLALPVISNNNNLNLSIHNFNEEINFRNSKDKLQNDFDFSKSNFFSFFNMQKEKEEKYQRLKSIKKAFRERKFHLTNRNEKIFYYIVVPGNASHQIKNCFNHRINWRECQSNVTTLFNFKWQQNTKGIDYACLSKFPSIPQMVNHFEFHHQISNKFNLFINITKYCEHNNLEVFNYLPFTIIIQYDSENYTWQMNNFTMLFHNIKDYLTDYSNSKSKERNITNLNGKMKKYSNYFNFNGMGGDKLGKHTTIFIPSTHYDSKNMWLIKAGNMNRGRCIKISDSILNIQKLIKQFYDGINKNIEEIQESVVSNSNQNITTNFHSNKQQSHVNYLTDEDKEKQKTLPRDEKYRTNSVIIQKYIESPLLYYGRKFDIRIWVMITHKFEVFAFKEGHLKTSSSLYDVNNINNQIHLTNYSVQKYCNNFSKYEEGNEVPFEDFQRFLDKEYGKNTINVKKDIFKKFKEIIEITCKSVQTKVDIYNRTNCFEIFGYDFIIDEHFNIFLLEVNTNPGLEESSSWIKVIVPRMLDDAIRLTIDDLFDTKYNFVSDEVVDKNSKYHSPYPVDGYSESDNLWDFVCTLKKNENEKVKLNIKKKKSRKNKKRKEKIEAPN